MQTCVAGVCSRGCATQASFATGRSQHRHDTARSSSSRVFADLAMPRDMQLCQHCHAPARPRWRHLAQWAAPPRRQVVKPSLLVVAVVRDRSLIFGRWASGRGWSREVARGSRGRSGAGRARSCEGSAWSGAGRAHPARRPARPPDSGRFFDRFSGRPSDRPSVRRSGRAFVRASAVPPSHRPHGRPRARSLHRPSARQGSGAWSRQGSHQAQQSSGTAQLPQSTGAGRSLRLHMGARAAALVGVSVALSVRAVLSALLRAASQGGSS